MARREQARVEAAFQRGDAGVDGLPTEEERRDEAELEKDKAREQLLRGRTYLGREFLTWLLWRSESTRRGGRARRRGDRRPSSPAGSRCAASRAT